MVQLGCQSFRKGFIPERVEKENPLQENRLTQILLVRYCLNGCGSGDVIAYNSRLEGRADLSRLQFLPVDVAEERMLPDGAVWTCRHAETRRRVTIQQLQQTHSALTTAQTLFR